MNKILLSLVILLFTSGIALAQKQDCTKLKLGKAYFECIKERIGGIGSSGNDGGENSGDGKGWYQKIKEGKPLFKKSN